jgi:NADH:ubiquinone oxidoreductase subunit 6 (subunit J)
MLHFASAHFLACWIASLGLLAAAIAALHLALRRADHA